MMSFGPHGENPELSVAAKVVIYNHPYLTVNDAVAILAVNNPMGFTGSQKSARLGQRFAASGHTGLAPSGKGSMQYSGSCTDILHTGKNHSVLFISQSSSFVKFRRSGNG